MNLKTSSTSSEHPPHPGSDNAKSLGCTCPSEDNGFGRGAYGGVIEGPDGHPLFWRAENCPIHGTAARLKGK